jgi:hypothetical protein
VGTKYKDSNLDAGVSAMLVPVYMNYYFKRDGVSPFVSAGATLVVNSGDVTGLKSKVGNLEFNQPVIPVVGLGIEARSDMGFMFRLTGNGMSGATFIPWFGFTFGYCF